MRVSNKVTQELQLCYGPTLTTCIICSPFSKMYKVKNIEDKEFFFQYTEQLNLFKLCE